jgi:hypothetical protein
MDIVDISEKRVRGKVATIYFKSGAIETLKANDVAFPSGGDNVLLLFNNIEDETPSSIINIDTILYTVIGEVD